ncbi:MAG: hypothetical protein GY946_11625, partial [bacterium]|nr:hypothetical protein [bacterium]
FDKLWNLEDTSDFQLLYLINLLYAFPERPAAISESLWVEAEQAVLDFKYWYTDDTPVRIVDGEQVVDQMWYWSENPILLFRVNEHLAGQLFPDRTFTVTGLTGAQHRARAEQEILTWIEHRARWGFTEWHSDVYYQKDLTPLLSLAEWCGDDYIAHRAAMLLDVLFLDIALHLHKGNLGATHGRSYVKDKASATTQDNYGSSKLFFDDTALPYASTSAADATLLSRARKYRLPRVLRKIARDDSPMVDRERMNLPLDEVPPADNSQPPPPAPYGLDWEDEANLPLWWSMSAQPLWMMLPLTFEVAERENLWDSQFSDYWRLAGPIWVEGDMGETVRRARALLQLLWPMVNQATLSEVNTYTHRTADTMLSTAQDYRKGLRGSQHHIWQATLGEQAIVFTQHPGYLPIPDGTPVPPDWNWQREDEPGPGYWTGEASLPRSAQHENVGIHIYAPQYGPIPYSGFEYRSEPPAYLPWAHFDEDPVQGGHWTFGRKGEGFVALYSLLPTEWRTGQPEVFENGGLPFDLVAPGSPKNVWIVEVGSAAEWGSFEAFRTAIESAPVMTTPLGDEDGNGFPDGFDVEYVSPSQGEMTFGWHEPLTVAGLEVPISDYPRFANPYVEVGFDERRYEISAGGYGLTLDFVTGDRVAEGPRRKPTGFLRWLALLFGFPH